MPFNGYSPEEQAQSDTLNAKLVHLNAQVNAAIAEVRNGQESDGPLPSTIAEIATVIEEVLPALDAVAQAARAVSPQTAVIAAVLLPVIHAAEQLAEWVKTYRKASPDDTWNGTP